MSVFWPAWLLGAAIAAMAAAEGDEVALAAATPLGVGHAPVRVLTTGLPSNLALFQDVQLSSTAVHKLDGLDQDGAAAHMVDGSRDTHFFIGSGCAETTATPDAWARIDFGREVPMAVVSLWTRTDNATPGVRPVHLYAGNSRNTWRDNLLCNDKVVLNRVTQPTVAVCDATGRYLWIVLRMQGPRVSPLSLCEVEVTPKGPTGTLHMLQTVSQMFNLELQGVMLGSRDRVRIVPDTVLCGSPDSRFMDENVLAITTPDGPPSRSTRIEESWDFVQIDRAGLYKVCWCGGDNDCLSGVDFRSHVATIIVNGIMMTAGGTGYSPNVSGEVMNNAMALATGIREPYGIAAAAGRIFFTEKAGQRVRWLDIAQGTMHILCGWWNQSFGLDNIAANRSELSYPTGLGLSADQNTLYIADSGSHRIRSVRVDVERPELSIITTVAGNGFRGFSGDGGPANQAQLNQPSCVHEDLNGFLWICDTGNNRLRVVSLKKKILVPGTNRYERGIIVTAAGNGLNGRQGDLGDGQIATRGQIGMPMAIAIDDVYVNPEVGRLPSAAYVAEAGTHIVRSLELQYGDYASTMNTLAGSREQDAAPVQEGLPQGATRAVMNSPAGVAVDKITGHVYISDTANSRILMAPTMQYVSLGCWRENVENPWIPSIEGQAEDPYLDGTPESRQDAIEKCALAALLRGHLVFALRLMGTCASSDKAHLVYMNEGASTSCSDGLGGAKDNSVYRFSRPGSMNEQLGMLYMFSGRSGTAAFSGDRGPAWAAELNYPAGLGVHPATQDLWIADTGNNRIRTVFSQVTPNQHHRVFCSNGFQCKVQLQGNGLQASNRLAVMPIDQECGQAQVAQFQMGFKRNPVAEDPSASYTQKTYDFGVVDLLQTGTFRLCFCNIGAVVYNVRTTCEDPGSFIKDAGVVIVTGPNDDSANPLVVTAGLIFDVALIGNMLSQYDRIRIIDSGRQCGGGGAAETTLEAMDPTLVESPRTVGNVNTSIWAGLSMKSPNNYRVCWCRGIDESNNKFPCNSDAEYGLNVATVTVVGPAWRREALLMGAEVEISILGSGLSAGDRIRIVDSAVACGSPQAANFSMSIDPRGEVPYGMAQVVASDRVTWRGVKIRFSGTLNVCWCGAKDGCVDGSDFNIHALTVNTRGPHNIGPPVRLNFSTGREFDLVLPGWGFTGMERVVIVEQYTRCGTIYANDNTPNMPKLKWPTGFPLERTDNFIRWRKLQINTTAFYRVCFCSCDGIFCCNSGEKFFTEAAIIYAGPSSDWEANLEALSKYVPPPDPVPVVPPQVALDVPPPTYWQSVPKDLPGTITVRAKTRAEPAHAGSIGPIVVSIYMENTTLFPQSVTLTRLQPGMVQDFQVPFVLDVPAVPRGIEVRSYTYDAWFCEYLEVDIRWRTATDPTKSIYLGSNRFSCNSWAAVPAQRRDRGARSLTDTTGRPPSQVAVLPKPQVAIWERRLFPLDPCGGCFVGFECQQVFTTEGERRKIDLQSGGTVQPTMAKAVCKPICGDGYAAPGEQCDDGNTRSFDGCSGSCHVENGFECANYRNRTSKCWPRLCERAVIDSKANTSEMPWDELSLHRADYEGYFVHGNISDDLMPPQNKAYVCYPWNYSQLCPMEVRDKTFSITTFSITYAVLQKYQFSQSYAARVDVRPFNMSYEGDHVMCDATEFFFPPLGRDGYGSYKECSDQCELSSQCNSAMFHITLGDGGASCPPDWTPQRCGARCRLFESDCPVLTPTPDSVKLSSNHDMYHVGRKIKKSFRDLGGEYFCSELKLPRPVYAHENNGMIIVGFDGPVRGLNGSANAAGFIQGEAFDCLSLLTDVSYEAVGGAGSSCRAVLADTMEIQLGALASINRLLGFDSSRQTQGDPGLLQFDSRKLRPAGVDLDFWALSNIEVYDVPVKTTRPLASNTGGRPPMPDVVIRGPTTLGGCGPLELTADTSSFGGGRRWRSAVWTCMGTRILNDTLSPLTDKEAKEVINACAPGSPVGGRIYELLKAKPWCGSKDQQADIPDGVLRPCELRIVIPSDVWCGVSHVRFKVELTAASGLAGVAYWDTEILPRSRIPSAAAIGSSEITMQPQRDFGAPFPRLRLEISTQTDFTETCNCRLTKPPALDGSEAAVSVKWYYAEVVNNVRPMFYDMHEVPVDESDNANVLIVPMRGGILIPGSKWLFVARAAYAVYESDEAALVPFLVKIAPLLPPKIKLRAPQQVNGLYCSFVLDASNTQLRELLYWTSKAENSEGSARRLQGTTASTTPTTAAPPTTTRATTTSTMAYSAVREQGLVFKWNVTQLNIAVDDAGDESAPPWRPAEFNTIRKATASSIVVPPNVLPVGLYVFEVSVSDKAFPNVIAKESVTVEVTSTEQPAYAEEGPNDVLGPADSTDITFTQFGFAGCPFPSAVPGQPPGRMLLMRGFEGDPPDRFEAIAELPVTSGLKSVSTYNKAVYISSAVDRSLLRTGFVYRYRMLSTGTPAGQDRMKDYTTELLNAGRRRIGNDPPARVFKREPLDPPDFVWALDSQPFTVVGGPAGGTLDVLQPLVGVGYAMQDEFKFTQIWATDAPPLQYSYFYARVSDEKEDLFETYRRMGFSDYANNERLASLVDGEWVTLSDWSMDPTMSTPLPRGLYVVGSKVRDANGMEGLRMAAVKVIPPWKDEVLTAYDQIDKLTQYISKSQQIILQVRGANRGAAAVIPLVEAVSELPDLRKFDFTTMLSYYNSSGLPNPMWSQPLYGTPILSREVRSLVVTYLREVMNLIGEIIDTLDATAITGQSRRLQSLALFQALPATNKIVTPSHVEALARAFRILAEGVGPVAESELFVTIGKLVLRLFARVRRAAYNMRNEPQAMRDLLQVEARLLGALQPADLPRGGTIKVNVSLNVEARLAATIIQGVEEFSDSLACFANTDVLETMTAPVISFRDGKDVTLGELKLATMTRVLNAVKALGVHVEPDYQDTMRWAYPQVDIEGLGEPGFLGQNWADADTKAESMARYQNAECWRPSIESMFDRISILIVSWPVSPTLYSDGTLVASKSNITLPYTVQLRSCGQGIDIGAKAGEVPGKLEMVFRLDTEVVRERRWGFGSVTPYRVAWWEDIPGIGTQAERIRRWTTLGCLTEWSNVQDDMIHARCGRLPHPGAGSVFAIELADRPTFIVEAPPPKNAHIHNLASYFVCLLIIRLWVLFYASKRGDRQFWPAAKDLVTIIFVPAAFRWQERVRKGQQKRQRPRVNWLSGAAVTRLIENCIEGAKSVVAVAKTVAGAELFSRLEVRELQAMRAGRRDVVYQHFVEKMDDKEHAEKVALHTFTLVQKAMAGQLEVVPEHRHTTTSLGSSVRQAWGQGPAPSPARIAQAPLEALPAPPTLGARPDHVDPPPPPPPKRSPRPSAQPAATMPGAVEEDNDAEQLQLLREAVRDLVVTQEEQHAQHAAPDSEPQSPQHELMERTAMPMDEGGLPPGWVDFISEMHGGKVYYVNQATGETTWNRPVQMPDGRVDFISDAMQEPLSSRAGSVYGEATMYGEQRKRGQKLGTLRSAAGNIRDPRDRQAPSRPGHSRQNDPNHRAPPPPDFEAPRAPQLGGVRKEAWHTAAPAGVMSSDDEDTEASSSLAPARPRRELRVEADHTAGPPTLENGTARSRSTVTSASNGGLALALRAAGNAGGERDSLREQVQRSIEAASGSTEVILPSGWDMHTTADGRDFYVNLRSGITQWEPPKLPAHWEERVARDGKVYYLSLFDGRTQWDWPQESAESRLLALPGSTELSTNMPRLEDSMRSDMSDDDTLIGAADQLDAELLLAMVPARDMDRPPTPRRVSITKFTEEEIKPLTKKAQEWQEVKQTLRLEKMAQDRRFATAKRIPGVREFVRAYEMSEIPNNWDRALDNATLAADIAEREKRELGHRAELKKEDLRTTFPVIQRLQWTKWSNLQIFVVCWMQAMPSQSMYLNVGRPSKFHRFMLHSLNLAMVFLTSCLMLTVTAPVSENMTALDRTTWQLIADFFEFGFQGETIGVALLSGLVGRGAEAFTRAVFFHYTVSERQPPLATKEAQHEQLRFWHELAMFGQYLCAAGNVVGLCGGITLCAVTPQPRAIGVVRSFVLVCLVIYVILPLIKASARTYVLVSARQNRSFDGLLNVYAGLMDFEHVGVQTPEFLAWRTNKIVQEEDLLRRVYEAADGKYDDIAGMLQDELEVEAECFKETFGSQQYPQIEDRMLQ